MIKEEPNKKQSGPVTASNGVLKSESLKSERQVCGPVCYNENEIAAPHKVEERITGYPYLFRG